MVNLSNIEIFSQAQSSKVSLSLYAKTQNNISKFLTNLKNDIKTIEVNYIKRVSGRYEANIEVTI